MDGLSNVDKSSYIIKCEYHPLSQTMVIALKNGILFLIWGEINGVPTRSSMRTKSVSLISQFRLHPLSFPRDTIPQNLWFIYFINCDFPQFSQSGHRLAVICRSGLFLWELTPNQGSYIFRGELMCSASKWSGVSGQSMNRVVFSPCDKYCALNKWRIRTLCGSQEKMHWNFREKKISQI